MMGPGFGKMGFRLTASGACRWNAWLPGNKYGMPDLGVRRCWSAWKLQGKSGGSV